VSFLRRLFGSDDEGQKPSTAAGPATAAPASAEELDEAERAHELELARFEQDRTSDLVRRQQRYSDRSWTPPAQGGIVRAGEESDEAAEEATPDVGP
jgi:hypothetical protein